MNKKRYIICIFMISVMAILVLNEHIAIPCIFYNITGYYCPGCGITRAVKALLKGDIYISFRSNMLIYIVIPVMIILKIFRIDIKNKRLYDCILALLLIFSIIFGILRNLPSFSFLAPIIISHNNLYI